MCVHTKLRLIPILIRVWSLCKERNKKIKEKRRRKKTDGGIAMVACFSTLNIHIDKKKLESSIYVYLQQKLESKTHQDM